MWVAGTLTPASFKVPQLYSWVFWFIETWHNVRCLIPAVLTDQAAWHHISRDVTHCRIPAVLTARSAWYHITGYKTQCHIPVVLIDGAEWHRIWTCHSVTFQHFLLTSLRDIMSQDIWCSVAFQWFLLTRLHGIMSWDIRHSVTLQRFLLTRLNGITSRLVAVSHSRGTDRTAWCHMSGGMTQCHIPAVLTELNGITSQETWHCHIPTVPTDRTEWHRILEMWHIVTFHQSLLARLHGVTPQEIAVPLFSTLKSFKSHMCPGFIYLSLFHIDLPLFLSWEIVFLHSNMK